MGSAAVLQSLPKLIIGSFLPWYLWEEPLHIIKTYIRYVRTFLEIISFTFLLRTLVSPWKGIMDAYPKKGLNLSGIAQTLVLNMTARTVGMIIRIFAIALGLAIQVILLAWFLAYLLLWYLYGFVAVMGIVYIIQS